WKTAYPYGLSAVGRLPLGQSNPSHLGMAENAGRDTAWIDAAYRHARNFFNAGDRLVASLVGQPGGRGNVADGVDAGLVGCAEPVCDDVSVLDVDRRILQSQVFAIAGDA